jgi:hypothetical protein
LKRSGKGKTRRDYERLTQGLNDPHFRKSPTGQNTQVHEGAGPTYRNLPEQIVTIIYLGNIAIM